MERNQSYTNGDLAKNVAESVSRNNIFNSLDEVLQYCIVGSFQGMPYRLFFHKLHVFEPKHSRFELEYPSGDRFNTVDIIPNCVLDFNIGQKGWAKINRRNSETSKEYKARKKVYYSSLNKN